MNTTPFHIHNKADRGANNSLQRSRALLAIDSLKGALQNGEAWPRRAASAKRHMRVCNESCDKAATQNGHRIQRGETDSVESMHVAHAAIQLVVLCATGKCPTAHARRRMHPKVILPMRRESQRFGEIANNLRRRTSHCKNRASHRATGCFTILCPYAACARHGQPRWWNTKARQQGPGRKQWQRLRCSNLVNHGFPHRPASHAPIPGQMLPSCATCCRNVAIQVLILREPVRIEQDRTKASPTGQCHTAQVHKTSILCWSYRSQIYVDAMPKCCYMQVEITYVEFMANVCRVCVDRRMCVGSTSKICPTNVKIMSDLCRAYVESMSHVCRV